MYSQNDFRYYSDELYHHGIPNQKWGVKNGPPYPLNREEHNRVVKGANPRMYKQNMGWVDEYTKFTKEMQNEYTRKHPAERIDEFDKLSSNDRRDLKDIRRAINHPKNRDDAGRHYNCPNCASAFEMVERGYDVVARPKANGSNVENIESFFKNGKLTNVGVNEYGKEVFDKWNEAVQLKPKSKSEDDKAYWNKLYELDDLQYAYQEKARDNVLKEMKSQGDGARGIFVVGWRERYDPTEKGKTTSFHAINYKNEKGKIVLYDPQSYRESTGNTDYNWIATDCDPRELYVMRTDNLEVSDRIGEAVISRRKA